MGTSVERTAQSCVETVQGHAACQNDDSSLSVTELTLLSLNKAYRSACNTLSSALGWYGVSMSKLGLSTTNPVVLLAQRYPSQECEEACKSSPDSKEDMDRETERLELDFTGCLWFSYRAGFSPLGADRLTGDVGWGCTLRSCQMMLAQALQMHLVGRMWSSTDAVVERARRFVVSQFHDDPGACLSIHSICTAGKKYGLVAGRWMGPYALCRAVADISRSQLSQHVKIIAIDSGGGAPCLDPARLHAAFEDVAPAPSDLYSSGCKPETVGLVILVPVVLGVERLNEVYSEQLCTVLQWKQSVGIVGGRPGHSYYFLGYQGNKMLCMDPHTMQSTDEQPGDPASHRPVGVHTVPTSAIDSTMALGFHCASSAELDALVSQIQEMAGKHQQTPLLSIGTIPDMEAHDCDCAWESSDDLAGSVPADSALHGEAAEAECANAATGSSTPGAGSASAEEVVPGGSGELCAAAEYLGDVEVDVEVDGAPAQANPDCAFEPELPAGDVHSTSASEWEMVSKQEECA